MIRNAAFVLLAAMLIAGSYACTYKPEDHVSQGAQGPSSPAESGDHGADAFNRPPYSTDAKKADAEHDTAGLTGPVTNGFVDHTMEDSGNLAWQGSYERDRRAQSQAR
ncbi:MAG TPA: hypothetical protein VKU01_24645 [Bryobacteraceae bacterium]|nr:hypothetical protein [Bryobacteraceae bacterium]